MWVKMRVSTVGLHDAQQCAFATLTPLAAAISANGSTLPVSNQGYQPSVSTVGLCHNLRATRVRTDHHGIRSSLLYSLT